MKKIGYYLLMIAFIFSACKTSEKITIDEKLNLEIQRGYIEDASDIPLEKKNYILKTFDEAEKKYSLCYNLVREKISEIETLKNQITSLEAENKILNGQARVYRYVRNCLIMFLVLFLLYKSSSFWLPIIRKLIFPI